MRLALETTTGYDTSYAWYIDEFVQSGTQSSRDFDTALLAEGEVIKLVIQRGAATLEALYTVLASDLAISDDAGDLLNDDDDTPAI